MKKYKVLLNGCNFWTNLEGQPKLMGLYTTRFVEADSAKDAENLAVQLIRGDGKPRQAVINDSCDPPIIHAEKIEEIETFEGIKLPGSGYCLYEDEGEGWA